MRHYLWYQKILKIFLKNQTPIRELYQYFDLRKDRMKYKEFREKDYFLGSGAIESANKYVIQARLKKHPSWIQF